MSETYETSAGIVVDTAHKGAGGEIPGEFPFTRGIHPTMYRGKLWTMRQYAGFGTAAETNQRFHELLEAGQTGLSVAFDLPTQMGHDSDSPLSVGEVGRVGVAIDSVEDMSTLFRDIPLDQVSTSMTINATAAVLLAMYVVVAEENCVSRKELRGTIQNDILKEYIARGTYIFPVEPSLRLVTDTLGFIAENDLKFNPISVSGYHIREAGATAAQEVAFTFANAIEYMNRSRSAGLDVDKVARRTSFFFAAHSDLFEEVAKFRAARRLWAKIMRERFQASDESCRLRFHTQTAGSTLTAQQPLNNVVRVAIQALSAALGGTQSLHTNAYDEALALPSASSARLALRTQQILACETGVTGTADPVAGSYYIEKLTDELENAVRELLEEIENQGGSAACIQRGYFQDAIASSAYRQQQELERGTRTVVGVNKFEQDDTLEDVRVPDYSALASQQVARLTALRKSRDGGRCQESLESLIAGAQGEERMMPLIIEAVRARATVGEICDTLRGVWGKYTAP